MAPFLLVDTSTHSKKYIDTGPTVGVDVSKTQCKADVLDGIGYVVETNINREYRTYRYGNPRLAECDQAKRVVLIEEIIADEFGL